MTFMEVFSTPPYDGIIKGAFCGEIPEKEFNKIPSNLKFDLKPEKSFEIDFSRNINLTDTDIKTASRFTQKSVVLRSQPKCIQDFLFRFSIAASLNLLNSFRTKSKDDIQLSICHYSIALRINLQSNTDFITIQNEILNQLNNLFLESPLIIPAEIISIIHFLPINENASIALLLTILRCVVCNITNNNIQIVKTVIEKIGNKKEIYPEIDSAIESIIMSNFKPENVAAITSLFTAIIDTWSRNIRNEPSLVKIPIFICWWIQKVIKVGEKDTSFFHNQIKGKEVLRNDILDDVKEFKPSNLVFNTFSKDLQFEQRPTIKLSISIKETDFQRKMTNLIKSASEKLRLQVFNECAQTINILFLEQKYKCFDTWNNWLHLYFSQFFFSMFSDFNKIPSKININLLFNDFAFSDHFIDCLPERTEFLDMTLETQRNIIAIVEFFLIHHQDKFEIIADLVIKLVSQSILTAYGVSPLVLFMIDSFPNPECANYLTQKNVWVIICEYEHILRGKHISSDGCKKTMIEKIRNIFIEILTKACQKDLNIFGLEGMQQFTIELFYEEATRKIGLSLFSNAFISKSAEQYIKKVTEIVTISDDYEGMLGPLSQLLSIITIKSLAEYFIHENLAEKISIIILKHCDNEDTLNLIKAFLKCIFSITNSSPENIGIIFSNVIKQNLIKIFKKSSFTEISSNMDSFIFSKDGRIINANVIPHILEITEELDYASINKISDKILNIDIPSNNLKIANTSLTKFLLQKALIKNLTEKEEKMLIKIGQGYCNNDLLKDIIEAIEKSGDRADYILDLIIKMCKNFEKKESIKYWQMDQFNNFTFAPTSLHNFTFFIKFIPETTEANILKIQKGVGISFKNDSIDVNLQDRFIFSHRDIKERIVTNQVNTIVFSYFRNHVKFFVNGCLYEKDLNLQCMSAFTGCLPPVGSIIVLSVGLTQTEFEDREVLRFSQSPSYQLQSRAEDLIDFRSTGKLMSASSLHEQIIDAGGAISLIPSLMFALGSRSSSVLGKGIELVGALRGDREICELFGEDSFRMLRHMVVNCGDFVGAREIEALNGLFVEDETFEEFNHGLMRSLFMSVEVWESVSCGECRKMLQRRAMSSLDFLLDRKNIIPMCHIYHYLTFNETDEKEESVLKEIIQKFSETDFDQKDFDVMMGIASMRVTSVETARMIVEACVRFKKELLSKSSGIHLLYILGDDIAEHRVKGKRQQQMLFALRTMVDLRYKHSVFSQCQFKDLMEIATKRLRSDSRGKEISSYGFIDGLESIFEETKEAVPLMLPIVCEFILDIEEERAIELIGNYIRAFDQAKVIEETDFKDPIVRLLQITMEGKLFEKVIQLTVFLLFKYSELPNISNIMSEIVSSSDIKIKMIKAAFNFDFASRKLLKELVFSEFEREDNIVKIRPSKKLPKVGIEEDWSWEDATNLVSLLMDSGSNFGNYVGGFYIGLGCPYSTQIAEEIVGSFDEVMFREGIRDAIGNDLWKLAGIEEDLVQNGTMDIISPLFERDSTIDIDSKLYKTDKEIILNNEEKKLNTEVKYHPDKIISKLESELDFERLYSRYKFNTMMRQLLSTGGLWNRAEFVNKFTPKQRAGGYDTQFQLFNFEESEELTKETEQLFIPRITKKLRIIPNSILVENKNKYNCYYSVSNSKIRVAIEVNGDWLIREIENISFIFDMKYDSEPAVEIFQPCGKSMFLVLKSEKNKEELKSIISHKELNIDELIDLYHLKKISNWALLMLLNFLQGRSNNSDKYPLILPNEPITIDWVESNFKDILGNRKLKPSYNGNISAKKNQRRLAQTKLISEPPVVLFADKNGNISKKTKLFNIKEQISSISIIKANIIYLFNPTNNNSESLLRSKISLSTPPSSSITLRSRGCKISRLLLFWNRAIVLWEDNYVEHLFGYDLLKFDERVIDIGLSEQIGMLAVLFSNQINFYDADNFLFRKTIMIEKEYNRVFVFSVGIFVVNNNSAELLDFNGNRIHHYELCFDVIESMAFTVFSMDFVALVGTGKMKIINVKISEENKFETEISGFEGEFKKLSFDRDEGKIYVMTEKNLYDISIEIEDHNFISRFLSIFFGK